VGDLQRKLSEKTENIAPNSGNSECEFLKVVYDDNDDNLLRQRTTHQHQKMLLHTLALGERSFVVRL